MAALDAARKIDAFRFTVQSVFKIGVTGHPEAIQGHAVTVERVGGEIKTDRFELLMKDFHLAPCRYVGHLEAALLGGHLAK